MYTATALAPTAPHTVRPGVPVAKIIITWAKVLGGVAILAVLLWRVGTGPFLDGLRLIDGWALGRGAGHRRPDHRVLRVALEHRLRGPRRAAAAAAPPSPTATARSS